MNWRNLLSYSFGQYIRSFSLQEPIPCNHSPWRGSSGSSDPPTVSPNSSSNARNRIRRSAIRHLRSQCARTGILAIFMNIANMYCQRKQRSCPCRDSACPDRETQGALRYFRYERKRHRLICPSNSPAVSARMRRLPATTACSSPNPMTLPRSASRW